MINGSLGFVLADAGYDVWLPNSRGNLYSMAHKKYNPSEKEFWDWRFKKILLYTLKVVIYPGG
jgi:hypothetical protein